MAIAFKWRTIGTVGASELVASPVASLGAVHYSEKLLPHKLKDFKCFVAKKIIEPHLETFEKIAGPVLKAHDVDNVRVYKGLGALVDPSKPYKELSTEERSLKLADILTKFGIAFTAETGASLASQLALGKALHANTNAFANVFVDTAVHLGVMSVFLTPLGGKLEDLRHGLARVLQKTLNMEEKDAKDAARIFTYVRFPGLVSLAATLLYATRGRSN